MASLEETIGNDDATKGMPPAKVERKRTRTPLSAVAVAAGVEQPGIDQLGKAVNTIVGALQGLPLQSQARVIKAAKLLLGGR